MIIMKITAYLKNEFSIWKTLEIVLLGIAIFAICINSILLKDSLIAVISALCGIMYTILAGKGKVYCFLFGLCGSCFYSFLSWQNALYGNLLLYLCYYVPAQILGFYRWKKNLKKDSDNEIVKASLSVKDSVICVVIAFLGCVVTAFILSKLNDSNPIIDGITTFLSILGMYLTVKRCIEQWIVWLFVNSLSLYMWICVLLNGVKVYSTLVMWSVYVILAVYFYIEWKKELSPKNI